MKPSLALITLFLTSCIYDPVGDDRLKVVNQSGYQIFVDYDANSVPLYPSQITTETHLDHPVNDDDTTKLLEYSSKPWPQFFERNKKLNLFIYSIDSLEKYNSIDTLIKRKLYKKIAFSKNEIEKLNWIVVIKDQ